MEHVVESTDLAAVRHNLHGAYGVRRIAARGKPHRLRMAQVWLGPVRLDRVSFAMVAQAAASPSGLLVFGHVTSGSVSYRSGGSKRRQRCGDVFLTAQPEHAYTASIHHTHADLAIVDPALVNQVAAPARGHSPQQVRFTGYRPVSPQAARSWREAYAYVRDQLTANPGAADHPLVAGNAARLLVATALTTFPNTALTAPAAADRRDASAAALRRAVIFIDENVGRDISAADIAGAAHTSIRAVQLAFRRHLDTTPMNYLRRVRLERARRQLLAADPTRTTVTSIACRWGFASPGRFTAYYRAAYGVLPSEALKS
jgi:AraC-like DNA-binding protein